MTSTQGQRQVEFLREILQAGGKIVRLNFSIEQGLGRTNPKYTLWLTQNGPRTFEEFDWTPELEDFLLHEYPTQTNKRSEECERFATILHNNLHLIEAQVGRDYARAVFVEVLKDRPQYNLSHLIAQAPTYPPDHNSTAYQSCYQYIASAIDGLTNTAVLKLKHPDSAQTVELVSSALGIVLDEIFHISLRRELFPK